MREKWIKYRAANYQFTHSRLLASEVIIFQAGKAYSNLDLNNKNHNNNKEPTVQKQYVNVCMYESKHFEWWINNAVPKELLDLW